MDQKKIGSFIRTLRTQRGMTQKMLAEQLNISDRTVSKWERGAGLPEPSLMVGLCEVLGITVDELLQGERIIAATQTKQPTIPKSKPIIAAIMVMVLLLCGCTLLLHKLQEDRILFPPGIQCEVLQKDADAEVGLTIDRRNSGVYDRIRSYEMDRYGNVSLIGGELWQSYTDAVPYETYKALLEMHDGQLTAVDRTGNGYLTRYYTDHQSVMFMETDSAFNVLFAYELDARNYTAACVTAFLQDGLLYILSYNSDEQRHYLTAVDCESKQEKVYSFNYAQLSGATETEGSTGGFLFDGDHMWVKDGVLCYAETYYGEEISAVLGAYDLEAKRALSFAVIEQAQVVTVRKEPQQEQVTVLLNTMDYGPLQLYTLHDGTMQLMSVTPLELPNEFLTRKDSLYGAERYLLFEADINEEHVAVIFADAVSREGIETDTDSVILAVYHRATGELLWRGRFRMDKEYEICEVGLLP